jgi:hypothetical protein
MKELEVQVEILSEHVARLEGIIDALLQEMAGGRGEASAEAVRRELPKVEN